MVATCSVETAGEAEQMPLVFVSKPGQPLGLVSAGRFGDTLIIGGASKTCKNGNFYLWAVPPSEDAQPMPSSVFRPAHSFSCDDRILFAKIFPDGKLLTTASDGLSTFYQTHCVESDTFPSRPDVSLSKLSSTTPIDRSNPTEAVHFDTVSSVCDASSEVAYALVDSHSARVSVLGVLGNQQSQVELVREFCYPPAIGKAVTACAVRCSAAGGSPLLVLGDLTGRLHFFDLRLASSVYDGMGTPIFTKAGSVRPITSIALHPFSSETVLYGCEDGTISMLDLRVVSAESSSSASGQTGFAAHSLGVSGLAFNATEPDQVFSAGDDGLLLEWSWLGQQSPDGVPMALPVISRPGTAFNCIAVDSSRHSCGPSVVAGSDSGDVYLVNY